MPQSQTASGQVVTVQWFQLPGLVLSLYSPSLKVDEE